MINIALEQAKNRYESLPEVLQDALLSVGNADEIWRIGEANHLNEEKISQLGRIAGRVIMGFTSMDDTAREIQENLNIDPRIASAISRDIKTRIFFPVTNEIRQNYAPIFSVPPLAAAPTAVEAPPAEVEREALPFEVTKEAPAEMPKPAPTPTQTPLTRPTPAATPPPPSGTPFMLFKTEEQKPISESIKSKMAEGFSLPIKRAAPPPVAARLEMPAAERVSPEQGRRVVHYNQLKTPINEQGQPVRGEELIDLGSFETVKGSGQPAPPAAGPKVQGNTLDLR